MHKAEAVPANEMHSILWDFEIQTDHLIQVRKPDLVFNIQEEKNLSYCGFCCASRPSSEKINKYLNLFNKNIISHLYYNERW